ncbi:transporter substrate-binding domain-containing protein [Propylenella binzhouense]|uniref:Amino acid ABC transporter substrate-binding protein n=1 Tax=Propylenella binzhouense TaxID=2555902 RepID=A0A964WRS3_9HYPH|nr:transporter substrate-binding domain-containing protein [Propylenella binzhouense]MYZ46218.1 amino acid ABC transporter substrate-binding protein [Propylenella binzhouense]
METGMTASHDTPSARPTFGRRDFMRAGLASAAGAAVLANAPAARAAAPAIDTSFEGFSIPDIGGSDSSLADVQAKGKLVVATANSWPFSFFDAGSNEWQGIDADIIRLAAKMLKIKEIDPQTVTFDGLVPGVEAGRFDMVGDSIMSTTERAKVVSFSFPTYYYAEALVVKKGNPLKLHQLADLKGHRVGTLIGSNYAEWLDAEKGLDAQLYQDWVQMLPELAMGRLDAVLYDQPVMAASLKDHPEWQVEMVEDYAPRSVKNPSAYSRYAFRQKDVQLMSAISAAVEWMQYNGEMPKILAKWGLTAVNN